MRLHVEDAQVLAHDSYPGAQFVLRVAAPLIAARAKPGSFAHIRCGQALPMRRPLSIMRTDAHQGWIEFLYKDVGIGTHELAQRQVGETINLIGPIGTPFTPDRSRPRTLLLGGGVMRSCTLVASELAKVGLDPACLTLEITESTMMGDPARTH